MSQENLNNNLKEEIIKYPKKIFIGFEKGTEKSDYEVAEKLAINYVKDNFSSKRNSFIKIEKIKNNNILPDGFIYEVQEEGEGISYVSLILENLSKEEFVLLKTKETIVQIEKNLENINCYYLTKNTEVEEEEILNNKKIEKIKENEMKPVFKEGYAMFSLGTILFSLSIISLFLALLFKFVLLNDKEDYKSNVNYNVFPINKIKNLDSSSNSKIRSIFYKDNNWYVQKEFKENGEIKLPEPQIISRESDNIKSLKGKINER